MRDCLVRVLRVLRVLRALRALRALREGVDRDHQKFYYLTDATTRTPQHEQEGGTTFPKGK